MKNNLPEPTPIPTIIPGTRTPMPQISGPMSDRQTNLAPKWPAQLPVSGYPKQPPPENLPLFAKNLSRS